MRTKIHENKNISSQQFFQKKKEEESIYVSSDFIYIKIDLKNETYRTGPEVFRNTVAAYT